MEYVVGIFFLIFVIIITIALLKPRKPVTNVISARNALDTVKSVKRQEGKLTNSKNLKFFFREVRSLSNKGKTSIRFGLNYFTERQKSYLEGLGYSIKYIPIGFLGTDHIIEISWDEA